MLNPAIMTVSTQPENPRSTGPGTLTKIDPRQLEREWKNNRLPHDPVATATVPPPSFPPQVLFYPAPYVNTIEPEPSALPAMSDSYSATSNESLLQGEKSLKTNQLITIFAIGGILIALVTGCTIVAIMGLIYSLQPKVPTGTVLLYTGNADTLVKIDNSWLFCDGSAVSRIKYSALFQIIGTFYGAGNGVDTFNLPDFRNRFPWGSSGPGNTTFKSGGSATHTLTIAQLPSHNHDAGSLGTTTSGIHAHSITQSPHNHGGWTNNDWSPGLAPNAASGGTIWAYSYNNNHRHSINGDNANIAIQNAGGHSHSITGSTDYEGQDEAFDKMPPYQTVHYIIRT